MPSVLTHYGFNKEVIDENLSFLKGNEDVYMVGAQGPDPFFFYGIIPFIKTINPKNVRAYGSKLHKLEPSEVFAFFFQYANNSERKDILYSYILGAGLHYILDRKVHPYVYYKTGFSNEPKLKRKYFVDHTLFETNLDVLLMETRFNGYKVTAFESIKCDINKIEIVSKMYGELAKKVVLDDKIDDNSFKNSYEHMRKIEKLLYSKSGTKKKIVGALLKNTPLNTMMHPKKVKDDSKIDYMNLKKSEWKDPATCVSYNKSLLELIDEAKGDAKIWFSIVEQASKGNYSLAKLKEFTKEKIYDGYDNKKEKMQVFDNVYGKGNS